MLVFVDTHILVYRFDTTEPAKQARSEDWLRWLWGQGTGRLSVQVLQELYATLTCKLPHALDTAEAQSVIRSLFVWNPVIVEPGTIEGAWANQERFTLSWWDALIVAAAQRAGCTYLLTEGLDHNQDMDGVRVIDPMQVKPGAHAP